MKRIAVIFLLFAMRVSAQEVSVYFDFDQYRLNDQAVATLEETLAKNPDVSVTKIYGYCDWKGTSGYNDTLSLRRVDEVYHFLRNKGVNVKPGYEAKGFGKDFEQSKVQAENRKVLVVFEKNPPKPQPESTKPLSQKLKDAQVGESVRLPNLYFKNNSAVLVATSQPTLYDLLCIMEENPTLKIEIQGHICCQTKSDQFDVSTARARAVYLFLVRNHIDRKRMTFKGYGISRPLHPIPEKSEQEADENRRVEVMVVGK